MRKNLKLFGALLAVALAVASCISPLDPATPRNKYVDDGGTPPVQQPNRFHPDSLFIIFKLENEYRPSLTITDREATVDTTVKPWAVWVRARGVYSGNAPRGGHVIYSFMLRIDSAQVTGLRTALTGDPRIGEGIMIVTGRVIDSTKVVPVDTLFSTPPTGSDGKRFYPFHNFTEIFGDLFSSFGEPRYDIESYIRIVL